MYVGFPGGSEFACNSGDPGSNPGSGRSLGEGNGNPLQHCCLENVIDRVAWLATVHGISKSWTQLSDSHIHTHTHTHTHVGIYLILGKDYNGLLLLNFIKTGSVPGPQNTSCDEWLFVEWMNELQWINKYVLTQSLLGETGE